MSSLLKRSRSSCKDQPCVTGFVAGFAHQLTADANVEFEAFNAYAEWCSDQAQVDGHQQETIKASTSVVEYIAPAPAVFYAAPAQVVEYLAPAPLAYAAPVAAATVGFGSLLVEPTVFR